MPFSQAVRAPRAGIISPSPPGSGVTNRSRLQFSKSTKTNSRVTFLLRLVAVILDSAAARCFRKERGFHRAFYEAPNFLCITHNYSFVDCAPSGRRAGQRHPEKQ